MTISPSELSSLLPDTERSDRDDRRHLGVASATFLILNRIIGTGIFSIPSSIYELTGSVGLSLAFWVVGGIIAACGFSVYLEFGLQMPHSGGEKNYLERIYYWPPRLALTIFSVSAVILSFSTSNSYAFGNYLQLGFGFEPKESVTRKIAVIVVGAICVLHARFPRCGRVAFNFLGLIKAIILVSIAACGPLLAIGIIKYDGGAIVKHNFSNGGFTNDGFGGSVYELGVALLRISYSYRGWETCNQVMSEIKDPQRTAARAGLIALVGISTLYTMCTYAYFAVIPKEEVVDSGVVIAGVFLLRLFGESASTRMLPLMICLSNLGNILVVTYAASRVTQEVGKHEILPFSDVLGSDKPWGTPVAGLALHFLMTFLTVSLPPPGEVYNFVIDVSTYPVTVFALMISLGMIAVHKNPSKWNWNESIKYRAPTLCVLIFIGANLVMTIFPWVPPPSPVLGLPYYASPLMSVIVLGLGAVYWYYRHVRIISRMQDVGEVEWVENTPSS